MVFCIYSESCFNPYKKKKTFQQAINFFRLVLQALSHFFVGGHQISVHFFKPLSLSCACGVRSQLKAFHSEGETSFLWLSPFQDSPSLSRYGCYMLFPVSSSQKNDGRISVTVLAAHALCDCDPLSGSRHTHTHTQTLTHVLIAPLDFDFPPQGSAFTYSSESSHSCLYFAQNLYQDRNLSYIYHNYFV